MSNDTLPGAKAQPAAAEQTVISRRTLVSAAAGFGVLAVTGGSVLGQDDTGPAPGDILVNSKTGEIIKPGDIDGTAKINVLAYAQDAAGNVKKGSENKIVLVRIDPETLESDSEGRGADGLMAYSAICTHAGCEIKAFDVKKGLMRCPCHGSMFDPANNGEVDRGPAKHRLASLAITVENDQIVVAEGFDAEIGAQA